MAALRIEVSGQMSALTAENEAKLARIAAQSEADSAEKEQALAQVSFCQPTSAMCFDTLVTSPLYLLPRLHHSLTTRPGDRA